MESFFLLIMIFGIGTILGFWYQKSSGRIRKANQPTLIDVSAIHEELGERATLLQFSSAFCTPCRTTRTLLSQVVVDYPGIKHIEIDAESNLELVRQLGIKSTPTTLVLDPAGVEISRAVGAPKRSDVIATLNAIR